MKIALSPIQYFDLSGYPLVNGRLRVYLHDSQDLCPLFTLSGDVYSPASNPVILDNAGEIHDTLWFDATVVDVKVDQRIYDGTYRQVSQFSYGFSIPDARNDTVVEGIAGLRTADPSLGVVTVHGYDADCVAPDRQYVWDSSCQADADDGCVVESDIQGADGRWILLWADEKLPCSVYGITPGYEANVSAFLSYPDTVGRWAIPMPRIPRFLPGTYVSDTVFTTSKTVYFDRGAQFAAASFRCPKAIVDEAVGGYVADFSFSQQDRAESRWFRTAEAFFRCGASELVQCPINYFEDSVVSRQVALGRVRLSGAFLPGVSFSGPGRLVFNRAELAPASLSAAWNVTFTNMEPSDSWFGDTGFDVGASSGHRTIASKSTNVFRECNFRDADLWARWLAENGETAIDLHGRTLTSVPASYPFVHISNGSVGTLALEHSARLSGVTVGSLVLDSLSADINLDDCHVTLDGARARTLAVHRGHLESNVVIDTQQVAFAAEDADIVLTGVGLSPSNPGDLSGYTSVRLDRCHVTGGYVANNMPQVRDCVVSGTEFDVYPVRRLVSGDTYLDLDFTGNRFTGTSFIYVTPGIRADMAMDVYEVRVEKFVVQGNRFDTDVQGLVMPFWAHDMQHRFIRGLVSDFGFGVTVANPSWTTEAVYSGNSGNCPLSYPLPQGQVTGGGTFTYGYAGTTYTYAYSGTSQTMKCFCLPASPDDGGYLETGAWIVAPYGKLCTSYRAKCLNLTLNNDASFPVTALMPACAIDNTLPNDMFTVRFVCIYTQAASGFQPLPSV